MEAIADSLDSLIGKSLAWQTEDLGSNPGPLTQSVEYLSLYNFRSVMYTNAISSVNDLCICALCVTGGGLQLSG